MCCTPLYAKKNHTSHGTQNVKTHNRTQKTKQKQKT